MPPAKPQGATLAGVVLSFGLAMALRIVPLPEAWFVYNPDWVALLLIYWTLVAPDRAGVILAFIVGLTADTLTGRLLGQHGLAYVAMAYLNLQAREPLVLLPVPLQCLWVLLLLLLGQGLVLWTQRIDMAEAMRLTYWLPALTGALVWPLLHWVMPALHRQARDA